MNSTQTVQEVKEIQETVKPSPSFSANVVPLIDSAHMRALECLANIGLSEICYDKLTSFLRHDKITSLELAFAYVSLVMASNDDEEDEIYEISYESDDSESEDEDFSPQIKREIKKEVKKEVKKEKSPEKKVKKEKSPEKKKRTSRHK